MATVTATENLSPNSIPATMRAAVYRGVNDVRVETVPVPEIGPGEVLMRIHTCGVCGTDLKKIHTGSHAAPRIFGHEMAAKSMPATLRPSVLEFRAGTLATASWHSITSPAAIAITAGKRHLPNVSYTNVSAAPRDSSLPVEASRNIFAS